MTWEVRQTRRFGRTYKNFMAICRGCKRRSGRHRCRPGYWSTEKGRFIQALGL